MNKLPLLALAGCLRTNYQIEDEELERCAPEVQTLEQSCDAWDGSFNKAVVDARECFGDDARKVILCSNPGPFELHSLYIGNYPQK